MQRAGKLSDAQRYGLAYAHLLAGHGAESAKELAPLLAKRPGDIWLLLASGQAKARAGAIAAADAIFEDLVARMPRNHAVALRSEEHTYELQSLMRISYAAFCLKKKKKQQTI